jgi:hypothetical protein
MNLRRVLTTGLAGAAAMGATTALDMRLRGRAASAVPAQALAKVPGLEDVARRHETALSWAALPVTAFAAGALRERVRHHAAFAGAAELAYRLVGSDCSS